MARSVRAVAAPQGSTKQIGPGMSMRLLSGSMGASPAALPITGEIGLSEPFEAPATDDAHWHDEIRRREAAEGLPAVPMSPYPQAILPGPVTYQRTPAAVPDTRLTDLSSLPPRFVLEIERKDDRWKVTAPAVHLGLWKSGPDLMTTVGEALVTLAEMVEVDGVTPAAKRRKK